MAKSKSKKTVDPEIDELETKLKELKKKQQDERAKKRREYEASRDELSESLVTAAKHLNTQLAQFKEEAIKKALEFRDRMLEYGDIRGGEKNKGNFEFKDASDSFKVVMSTNVIKGFDERADMGETHLKTFLESFVKKRDITMYNLIMSLLERNKKTGKLDISNINRLYTMEDQIDDPEFKKALQLFKESYNEKRTATYIRFFFKSETTGEWVPITLNIASA